MCRLRFKVTHTSTYRTVPPPAPRPTHRGGRCAPWAATAPHPHRHRGYLAGTAEDLKDGES